MTSPCGHFETGVEVDPPLDVCSACMEIGGTWVNLRQCLACGRTSCCNDSPNRHATAHFLASGHQMIQSARPGEDWRWCYADEILYVLGPAGYEVAED